MLSQRVAADLGGITGNMLDDLVGQVVDGLEAAGLWDNSLLVFHSDNGGEILGGGLCGGNNWPLTGGKFSNWCVDLLDQAGLICGVAGRVVSGEMQLGPRLC